VRKCKFSTFGVSGPCLGVIARTPQWKSCVFESDKTFLSIYLKGQKDFEWLVTPSNLLVSLSHTKFGGLDFVVSLEVERAVLGLVLGREKTLIFSTGKDSTKTERHPEKISLLEKRVKSR